jgi:hypothetical protein
MMMTMQLLICCCCCDDCGEFHTRHTLSKYGWVDRIVIWLMKHRPIASGGQKRHWKPGCSAVVGLWTADSTGRILSIRRFEWELPLRKSYDVVLLGMFTIHSKSANHTLTKSCHRIQEFFDTQSRYTATRVCLQASPLGYRPSGKLTRVACECHGPKSSNQGTMLCAHQTL